jgi:hypothetical protein
VRHGEFIAVAIVAALQCKSTPKPTAGNVPARDGGTSGEEPKPKSAPGAPTFAFTIDGRPVTAHRVTIERAGNRAYLLAACDIDGAQHIVDLSPSNLDPGTYVAGARDAAVVFKIINTRTKEAFESTRVDAGASFFLAIDSVPSRLVGTFGGTIAGQDGKSRVVAGGAVDMPRTQDGAKLRATVEFELNGVQVRGFVGAVSSSATRHRYQAMAPGARRGETVTFVLQTPSLAPGVYSYPGTDLDVRIIHIVAGDAGTRAGADLYWLNPQPGVMGARPGAVGGRFRLTIEAAGAGRRATFDGELVSHGKSQKAVILNGVMRIDSF